MCPRFGHYCTVIDDPWQFMDEVSKVLIPENWGKPKSSLRYSGYRA